MSVKQPRLLIAASGTGGHLFPALAVAQQLPDYHIQWLGVPNRLETTLVPSDYRLHTVDIEGFQTSFGIKTIFVMGKMLSAIARTYQIIKKSKIEIVFTTGGYIAAPAIIAAKLAKIPVILHESNYIPGKVTKLLGKWCKLVAIGFRGTEKYLLKSKTQWVSTPVREEFLQPQTLPLDIPDDVPLIVAMGGSQGAVALNKLVRRSAPQILDTGAYIVHLTGNQDDEIGTFTHPHYLEMPFYDKMGALLQRANLAISRSGAGSLTELAITKTPSILIPYPFAAEDHQFFNGQEFVNTEASLMFRQEHLSPELLTETVLDLLNNHDKLMKMSSHAQQLADRNSASAIAHIIMNELTYTRRENKKY
ncbi:undecaprenyldiphospho-muramoylpentapeptide beta-N-acetylglucosaminyltransferase [Cyanobacterium aponinum UTEX 3221]|uniref:undecaprenyldiphospho-muramoylpentapeptide beta-N-acetylglucosaminyltransferase n=1 Tax=Cyanobacterium aponinum TaxID=379064 RepID=UPI0016818DBB|nr:undecaprenyldiphospho-muramoylpentapeptide beta-N-acetylglucosaminyltransferase [Cyanobacterium aponinum]MBD2393116.1 undecaprenyldiphospho-muramoylpentapeptide beta-N-acetylglucosaminyltransferase [Cyanobacterium aponinum FACHB-4101]WRL39476.1 undecaprenyldiphospho-muramoylpentapeptide beta-N-acetylglucosaminyltransferase [Cyanobacterium aponinum UTEX 3221]